MAWFDPSPPALEFLGGDRGPAAAQVDRRPEAAVILHRAVNFERSGHVIVDIEELADGEDVVEEFPGPAFIIGDSHPLVEPVDQVIGILRVDP
jgi:hypothetical protein